jgi:hypothetical protein
MARARDKDQQEELPAQDSFLDLIANIVGIMILLVVIVGIRAGTSVPGEIIVVAPNPEIVSPAQVEEAIATLRVAASEHRQLVDKAQRLDHQADQLDGERVALMGYVDEVERELNRQRDQLDAKEKEEFDVRVAIAHAEDEHDELARQLLALDSGVEHTTTLRNVATPIARTVTQDEVTLWVHQGRVSVVPKDELLSLAERDISRRSHVPSGISTVGPLNGFLLQYALVSRSTTTPSGGVARMTGVVGEIKPADRHNGWPIDEACAPNSALRESLARYRSSTTAVTFWTPGAGFKDVGRLRELAANLGFSTAIRPLPEGRYIQFSPWGRKTRAQ